MTMADLVERPAHVPEELVVDFDFMRPGADGSDPFLAWRALHGLPPLVWTPRRGGHWIATRGADIPLIFADHERFSSRKVFIGLDGRPRGVPLEYDPPEHTPLRKLIMPAFFPAAIRQWTQEAERLAIDLIEGFRARGRCEFMADFAYQLPMIIFLKMMNLPLDHREMLIAWVSTGLRSTDETARAQARGHLNDYIGELVAERTARPGEDILSQAIQADLGEGRPMTHEQALGLASALLGGGLDTVAATMGWMALHLAEHPALGAQLIADPKRITKAIEELMRRYSIANIARVVRDDMSYEGTALKAGEQILMASCVHGLDDRSFPDALAVDLDRRDSYKHSTLSHGVHRCIGAPLANQEMRIFLEQWLTRIPQFEVDPDVPPVMMTGIAHGLTPLGLRWAV